MEKLVNIFKALGDKNRMRIVKMLQQKPLCVCEITAILQLAPSTVSKHLSILNNTEIIGSIKDGKWVEYHLQPNKKNVFLSGILLLITYWINDDEKIKSDLQKLETTNKDELCNV